MFTGIVEETAVVIGFVEGRLWLDVSFADEVEVGDSVCVSGVCLTVIEKRDPAFTSLWRAGERGETQPSLRYGGQAREVCFEIMDETEEGTYLGELSEGDLVNVERAMRADGRLDGHIVQGHVDGVGSLNSDASDLKDGGKVLKFVVDNRLARYMVEKGSVAVDGISLTIIEVGDDWFSVGIIPYTREMTNLKAKEVGSKVHIEVDVLAKYVEKLVGSR